MPEIAARIALAAWDRAPAIHADDVPLVDALRAAGVAVEARVWSDPSVDWSAYDAVLVRTIWDYFQRYADYLAWLERMEQQGAAAINPLPVLRWNADKRYLRDLADAGVAIVPTRFVAGSALSALLPQLPLQEHVIKPAVSGGAWHTVRGRPDDAGFVRDVAALPRELQYLVQPFLPEIVAAGEWSLLYFDGVYSHAVLKRSKAGDYRVQADYGGTATLAQPPAAIRSAADHALAAAATCTGCSVAYARVDGVWIDERFVLMEIELIEPLLHLQAHAPAALKLAEAILKRLPTVCGAD